MKTLLFLLAVTPFAQAQRCPVWDVVYYNGNVLTGRDLTGGRAERVRSFAVDHGLIVKVDATDGLKGCAKESVDLHGAFVMAGFNDAHTHIAFAGQQKLSVDLDNVPSLGEMQAKIRGYTAALAPGEWITGGGWDHTKWASKTLPTRQDLDAVTGSHPAYLERTDGHIAVVNSAALAAAGITGKTVAPQGSKIDLDAKGQPTGIVREGPALSLLQARIPKPSQERRRQALALAMQDAVSHGVTSVQDFSDWDDFLTMESLERDGKLPLRVSEWLTFNDPVDVLKAHRDHHPLDDPMLHTGMLKGFMDGSLGSRTAALAAPYSDDPGNSGIPRYEQEALNKMAMERVDAGFPIGFHAIGDRANSMALEAFASVKKADKAAENADDRATREEQQRCVAALPVHQRMDPARCNISLTKHLPIAERFRIEHAQVLLPTDFSRFAELHIIASMQPSHLLTDMAWAGERLGPERVKYAYAWKSFLHHHVTLAFGTDYPVESVNPFRGLYSAVTRQNEAGTQTFQPQEKLTLYEAVYAYTQGSAFAEGAETKKGQLAAGFYADFVVLDRDITKATPQELLHARVLRTVVGGKTVYAAPANAAAGDAPACAWACRHDGD